MVENSRKDGARSVSKMKQTEIGVIPEDWEVMELKDIASIVGGGTPKTNIISYWKDDINWFTPTELGNCKFISESIRKISYEGLRNSSAKLLPKGTILLTTRASIGDTAILLNEATTNQGFQSLIVNNNTSNEYIYYLIETLKPQLLQNASGSTFLEISPNKVKSLQIPLPPLPEQEAIAEALSDADAWIESLERLIAKKRLIKQGAMQELLTPPSPSSGNADGEALEPWEVKKLGEVIEKCTTGKLDANAMVENGDYRFYTCAREFYYINEYAFDDEALLISGNGANVGYIHYYKGKFNAYQRTYVLLGFKINALFLKVILDKNLKDRIAKEVSAGNTPYIKMDTITDMVIKFPKSLSEQTRIATILSDMDAELEALERQLGKARQIKQGMMQELLTGRVRLV